MAATPGTPQNMQNPAPGELSAAAQAAAPQAPKQVFDPDPPKITEVAKKTYFCATKNSGIYVQRIAGSCDRVDFIGHRLETTDLDVQKHLDQIIDRSGSGIFSSWEEAAAPQPDSLEAAQENLRNAQEVVRKMIAAGEKVV